MDRLFFAKIELWAVLLLGWLAVVGALAFGWAVYRGEAGLGRVGQLAVRLASLPDQLMAAATASDPYLAKEARFAGLAGTVRNSV